MIGARFLRVRDRITLAAAAAAAAATPTSWKTPAVGEPTTL